MKRLFYLLILICGLLSCSNELEETQSMALAMSDEPISLSVSDKETKVERGIKDYISHLKFGNINARRSTLQTYSLTPYIYRGDTVMYIANYASGWDLFSANQRTPLVMLSSDTGAFDPNDPSMAPAFKSYLNSVADELYRVKQSGTKDGKTYGLWQAVYIQNDEVDLRKIEITPRAVGTQPGSGYWELISTTKPVTSTHISNRLTATRWGQENPWNVYVPFVAGSATKHCLAGCAAVAAAQYLYYLRYKNNKPASTVTTATYSSASNTYSYTGSSSTIWNQMAKTASDSGTDYAAILIGYVGNSVGMGYGEYESGVNIGKIISFINGYGYNYKLSSMEYGYITSELIAGRAVYARSDNTGGEGGHQFIIDRYRSITESSTSTFGWVGTDNLGQDSNEYDENGNIVGYSFFYDRENKTSTYAYTMNWGWGISSWDNVYFNASDNSEWNTSYKFNTNRQFLK